MKRRDFLIASGALMAGAAGAAPAVKLFPRKLVLASGNQTWTATLYDNATVRALAEKLPLTVTIMDLYERELCYRFREALPANEVEGRGYEVGELIYWPPGHSFVVMYDQNGEEFFMQSLGRLDGGVETIRKAGGKPMTLSLR